MKRYRSTKSLLATIAAAMLAIAASLSPARSQDEYPSKQITLIAPYPPGGVVDMTARMLAEGLKEKFNQSVIVLNKAGANGMIGLSDLVKAEPDGYTFLLNNDGGLGIPPAVDPNFKFDPMKDYTPVAQVVQHGWMFIINSGIPAKTMQEFIAYAKARPGEMTFGTPGIATLPHIATELFMLRAGVKMVHVPYKGAAPALTDLIAGTVQVNVQSVPTALGQIGNERLKVLAVFNSQRLKELPNVPTMEESGLSNFVITSWLGLFGPPGLPAAIRDKLSHAVVGIVQQPRFQEKFRGIGFEPVSGDATTFGKLYYSDVARWKTFANENGIKLSQ